MIISCDRCASQFQLDEAKLPRGGAKVRCSRCQHTLVVQSPAQTDVDLAETWVREALGDPDAGPGATAPEGEESDWGFNDDSELAGVMPGSGFPAARDAVESPLGEVGRPTPPPVGADFESQDFAHDARPADVADGFDPDSGDKAPLDPTGACEGLDLAEPNPEQAADEIGDLDELSNWNLFDEETPTTYAEVPSPEAAQTGVEFPQSERAPESAADQPHVGLPGAADAALDSGWGARAGEFCGWGAVAVLIVACLFGGLGSSEPEAASGSWEWSGAGFDLQEVHGRWVDNASIGPLYVISGRLRRSEGSSPWDALPLAIELVDAAGQPIEGTRTAIGPEIPSRYLHESNPNELLTLQHNRARQFAAFAGTWRQFDAVVIGVPAAAERFSFNPRRSE